MIEVTPYISPCRKGEDPTSKKLHLRVSKPSTDTPEDVVKGLEHSTTATAADIRAVLSGLRDYIINALSQGRSVQLEGLGRISAIPHFTKAVLPNEKFRNADIETKAVQFLPEREFLKAVRHQTRYHAGPMHMAKDATVDDALLFCKEWLAGHDVLIAADLMRELQIGRSRASRLLRELVRCNELVGKKYGAVVQYKAPLNPPFGGTFNAR